MKINPNNYVDYEDDETGLPGKQRVVKIPKSGANDWKSRNRERNRKINRDSYHRNKQKRNENTLSDSSFGY